MQVMLCQSDLILLHKWGLVDSQSHSTVSFENALCPDYSTKKFYLALRAVTLPIVYGGKTKTDYEKVSY